MASDGACQHQELPGEVLRNGFGIYYGEDNACNENESIHDVSRGAQRAEVAAAQRCVAKACGK